MTTLMSASGLTARRRCRCGGAAVAHWRAYGEDQEVGRAEADQAHGRCELRGLVPEGSGRSAPRPGPESAVRRRVRSLLARAQGSARGDLRPHAADWSWNGYDGTFGFRWEFGVQLAQPGATYDHDTRFVEFTCPASFDPQKSLDEELVRLRAEAEHYAEMRGAMMRWARDARSKSLATEAAS